MILIPKLRLQRFAKEGGPGSGGIGNTATGHPQGDYAQQTRQC